MTTQAEVLTILAQQLAANVERCNMMFEARQKLIDAGFPDDNLNISSYDVPYAWHVRVNNPKDFSKVHKAFGKLVHLTMTAESENKIRIYLRPDDKKYGWIINFTYIKDNLPKDGKCKVVKSTFDSYKVVCENK